MRRPFRQLIVLLLIARPVFSQVRVEPLTPRLSPAPVFSPTSLPAVLTGPSPAAPVPLPAAAPPAPAAVALVPAAPALPASVAAAVDGPSLPSRDALTGAQKAAAVSDDSGFSARSLNSFWDGLGAAATPVDEPLFALPEAGLLPQAAGAAASGPELPSWLALHDKKHAAALAAAVKLARSTKAGRRALDEAGKALEDGGRVLRVDVLDLGRNYGEYDYLEDRMRLDKKMFLPGREVELAGTLAHELLHVAQHATGLLPSNALELEIEAHLLDLALMEELGIEPPADTFARQSAEALAESPAKFIELMQAAVPGSPFLGESSFAEIADQLEQDYEDMSRKKSARSAKLAGVIGEDLRLIRSRKGRAAYRAFSERVLAELERRSAAARR